jgi:response regulator NasT
MAPLHILIADADAARAKTVQSSLEETGDDTVVLAPASDLAMTLRRSKPDAVILAVEALDKKTIDELRVATKEAPRPVVVFVERADDSVMRDAIAAGVSSLVVAGLAPPRVRAILDVAIARFQQTEATRVELETARANLAERKTIDRAKGILMQQRGLSEDDAYKALRKEAMDRGRKIADVAQAVISVAELLKR